ncbi:cellulose binding domain-containing protein [Saccharothrix sp. 6-C]|nr:cellulose binding domain-containing protein [Saccharothrix sp. 6-C]
MERDAHPVGRQVAATNAAWNGGIATGATASSGFNATSGSRPTSATRAATWRHGRRSEPSRVRRRLVEQRVLHRRLLRPPALGTRQAAHTRPVHGRRLLRHRLRQQPGQPRPGHRPGRAGAAPAGRAHRVRHRQPADRRHQADRESSAGGGEEELLTFPH